MFSYIIFVFINITKFFVASETKVIHNAVLEKLIKENIWKAFIHIPHTNMVTLNVDRPLNTCKKKNEARNGVCSEGNDLCQGD
jgi:hypothetical protein